MAMIKYVLACILLLGIISGCHTSHTDKYTYHKQGFYYKLLAIGDGKIKPSPQSVLACNMILRTQQDSVFFNTKRTISDVFYIPLMKLSEAGGKSYFYNVVEGDSISVMIRKDIFFRNYFDTITPLFCQKDSLIKMDVRIDCILSPDQYKSITHSSVLSKQTDNELRELQVIDSYLKGIHKNSKPDGYGIYTLAHTTGDMKLVNKGSKVKVEYSGFFLDGKPIDNGNQIIEFTFGTPDQLVKGLNIVIGNLKKGETIKIILPSRLAFGELGSSNGSIPPFTPLVYNVKLIDIK